MKLTTHSTHIRLAVRLEREQGPYPEVDRTLKELKSQYPIYTWDWSAKPHSSYKREASEYMLVLHSNPMTYEQYHHLKDLLREIAQEWIDEYHARLDYPSTEEAVEARWQRWAPPGSGKVFNECPLRMLFPPIYENEAHQIHAEAFRALSDLNDELKTQIPLRGGKARGSVDPLLSVVPHESDGQYYLDVGVYEVRRENIAPIRKAVLNLAATHNLRPVPGPISYQWKDRPKMNPRSAFLTGWLLTLTPDTKS
jgi:hypothetical protein